MVMQFVAAQRYRTVGFTKLNPFSSRGHCIMFFKIHTETIEGAKSDTRLTFGDLAGSEVNFIIFILKTLIFDLKLLVYACMGFGLFVFWPRHVLACSFLGGGPSNRSNIVPNILYKVNLYEKNPNKEKFQKSSKGTQNSFFLLVLDTVHM